VIAGDIRKFRSCTGWTAEIELTRTLRDMLDWWRQRLGRPMSTGLPETQRSEVRA
jgi:hypothetical protein